VGDLVGLGNLGDLWLYLGKRNILPDNWVIHIGRGFGSMRLYFPGDWNRDGKNDLIAINKAGQMFLYPGNGKPGFGKPTQIGHGWNAMPRVIPAGDLNRDGNIDLLAIDKTGKLYLYSGNGKGGFKAGKKQVGHGWNKMQLYPAGDLNRDRKNDILGIDSTGKLFFYAGKGTGSFQKAVQVGHGWKGMRQLAAGADMTGDGLADIIGWAKDGQVFLYAGRGGGKFGAKVQIGRGFNSSGTCPGATVKHPTVPGALCPDLKTQRECYDAVAIQKLFLPYNTGTKNCGPLPGYDWGPWGIGNSGGSALRPFPDPAEMQRWAVSVGTGYQKKLVGLGDPSLKLKIEILQGYSANVDDLLKGKTNNDPYYIMIVPMVCKG